LAPAPLDVPDSYFEWIDHAVEVVER